MLQRAVRRALTPRHTQSLQSSVNRITFTAIAASIPSANHASTALATPVPPVAPYASAHRCAHPFSTTTRLHQEAAPIAESAAASSDMTESTSAQQRSKGRRWATPPNPQLIELGNLQPRPGTMKKPKRVGRGSGSGLGKTAGKGHKGQGQRKGLRKRGFEGGSTPFWRRTPKLGISNAERYWRMLTPLTVRKIQEFIKLGRIDGSQLITMKTLYDSGCLTKIENGVKLLSGGLTKLDQPIHIQLTDCSEQSRQLLESNGGSVHLVWFNRTTLRAHLNPVKFLQRFGRLPKATGVPPPKKAAKYGFVVEHVDY